jgi:hypothetical protein
MPTHILVNKLGLTYKSTIGVSIATIPDVCKTPSPGGPVPIPYPNFANQGSLKKGTKTVKAKGKMIAVKGSEYSMSFGDEPGTAGGVKSSTFKKETSWITYSFDVKMDGKNACRHTDKKFHNHKNTVDLAGNLDPALPLPSIEQTLQQIAKDCEEDVENDPKHKDKNCRDKGTEKHKCCDQKIEEELDKQGKDEPRGVFSDGAFDKNSGDMIGRKNPIQGGTPAQVPRKRDAIVRQAIGFAASKGQPAGPAIGGMLSGKKFPDVVVSSDPTQPPGPGNTKAVYDFKFPCPKDKKPKWGDNGKQGETYDEMLSPQQAPKMITPTGIF